MNRGSFTMPKTTYDDFVRFNEAPIHESGKSEGLRSPVNPPARLQ